MELSEGETWGFGDIFGRLDLEDWLMGWGGAWGGVRLKVRPAAGAARAGWVVPFTNVGKTGGSQGDEEWGARRGQGLQACPDSKVKEVIISCSFPASRVGPDNPILQAEETTSSPLKSRVRAER